MRLSLPHDVTIDGITWVAGDYDLQESNYWTQRLLAFLDAAPLPAAADGQEARESEVSPRATRHPRSGQAKAAAS